MEYPKMLYSGDKVSYSSRIAHNADEEAQFRNIGLTDYAELPDPEPAIIVEPEAPQGFVTTERFDAVAERLAVAEAEIKRLHEVVVNPEPKTTTQTIDYESMTNDQLRALLDEKGIEYLARDGKAELIARLG